ncbi:hypothetical protein K435DRAFT_857759 [Dendrothele bispora CBS 962.96]|uniref:Uncharacterized protein n=1 Tax=Dendrothele bispora (strain CBS 962.96) TaxID=1314807 RepID=A0A4S8M5H1_DENBC|nr:hypothetical protein K435DRAFT_857759 [Dendrothele bispora CBS 962.96]
MAPKTRTSTRKQTSGKRTAANKQSARKSTGGPAPRANIGSGISHAGLDDVNVPAASKRKEVGQGSHRDEDTPSLAGQGSHGDEDTPSQAKRSRTKDVHDLATYETHFAKVAPGTRWCAGCKDDTVWPKVKCERCHNVVCYGGIGSNACMELNDSHLNNGKIPDTLNFLCLSCTTNDHATNSKVSNKFHYYAFRNELGEAQAEIVAKIKNRGETQWFKPLRMPSLAIVLLQVAGSTEEFSAPFEITKFMLAGYSSGMVSVDKVLENNLQAPEIPWNEAATARPIIHSKVTFDLLPSESDVKHAQRMTELINAFERFGVTEVIFFLVTHSDPESGDIHFTAGGQGAERLSVVGYSVLFYGALVYMALPSTGFAKVDPSEHHEVA